MVSQSNKQVFTRLNNGVEMPMLGLGVYDMHGKEAEQAIQNALEVGYRLVDTAAMYGNEKEVGNAIKKSDIPRAEIFITSKVNNIDQGYDSTLLAFERSLGNLRTEYVDLYLIHWPIRGKRRETWKALEKIYEEGQVRTIGVANYLPSEIIFLRYPSLLPYSCLHFISQKYSAKVKPSLPLHPIRKILKRRSLPKYKKVYLDSYSF
jgi:diketogulonate reductase-like aldo/keto reductase